MKLYTKCGTEFLVDDEDMVLLKNCTFMVEAGYIRVYHPYYKIWWLHRLLCPGKYVDHRDRNKMNNQKTNLRACTQRQNLQNMRSRGGTSKYKGVSWNTEKEKWVAQIRDDKGKKRFLGYHLTENAAYTAWKVAAELYHREFYCEALI